MAGWPSPHQLEDDDAREVIYIDHNHFHRRKRRLASPRFRFKRVSKGPVKRYLTSGIAS